MSTVHDVADRAARPQFVHARFTPRSVRTSTHMVNRPECEAYAGAVATPEQLNPTPKSSGSGCLLWLGLALLVPATGQVLGWLSQGLSGFSAALGLGLGLLALGCCGRSLGIGAASRLLGAGAALVLAPWLWRAVSVKGSERVRLTTLPDDGGARLVNKLYPERDGTLLAAKLLGFVRPLHDDEAAHFPQILEDAFARTDPPASDVPTPAIATYLGLESATQFDALVISPPPGRAASDAALIFLHGYAGNFYIYCWEIAQAAAAANLITICPSTDASGRWWMPGGEQVFQQTLDYAHRSGMNRVYLAGLSNGGAGASELALSHARELSGLVLISGSRAQRPPPLPTLVIQGATDRMMPTATARTYAAASPRAEYHELPGGHLIMLSRYQQVRPLIANFLLKLEQGAPGSPLYSSERKR